MQQPMKCTEFQEAPRNQAWRVLSNWNCSSSIREYQVESDTPKKPHIPKSRLVILVLSDFNAVSTCLTSEAQQVLCKPFLHRLLLHTPKFSSVPFSCSVVSSSLRPWTAACQASLSITNSRSLLKLMSIESVMPSNHLIICCPILLLPSIFPSISLFQRVSSSHQMAKVLEFQLQHQSFQLIFSTGFL